MTKFFDKLKKNLFTYLKKSFPAYNLMTKSKTRSLNIFGL